MAFKNQIHIDEELNKATLVHAQPRRKGIGTRVWLAVLESGESRLEEVGKPSIMRRTGLPARDLRVLDPMLSYPSTILGRERAIVINLEHIKAIITAKEVLMVHSTNPLVVEFVEDLKHRIACSNMGPKPAMDNIDRDMEDANQTSWDSPSSENTHGLSQRVNKSLKTLNSDENIPMRAMEGLEANGPKLLPFEFKALEACLESACRCLESETQTLELEAYPALDELTSQISTLTLERVRQIKSRLVAISGRVQKVRDELEHLLDDDNDMAEMYLTEKIVDVSAYQTSLKEDFNNEADDDDECSDREEAKTETQSVISTGYKPNIEELEMLLEAYFAQIDGTSQKLFHMTEYVNNTEDFVNIMLDEKQNQLLQMGVMLSTANMILNAGIVVVGLFGMNIQIELFGSSPKEFAATAYGTVGGCLILYLIAFGWGRKKRLL